MTLAEQKDALEMARSLIADTSIRDCLRLRIVHCKASRNMPERYRAWVYAHGYKDPDDGTSSPWLLEASWIQKRGIEWLARYLVEIATHADNFND